MQFLTLQFQVPCHAKFEHRHFIKQVAERGGLRVQNGFFARFCIDRMGIAVQSLRDNPPGA